MKISVVMATYNGEKYITEQMESIIHQTQRPDEVVISDDHSTDATRRIIEEYIERRGLSHWKLIENERGNGVTRNYINALRFTTGDIVFLCDQDDIWENNKIEIMASSFDRETGCVISAISYIDQDGNEIKKKTAYTNKNNHKIDLSELCSICSFLGMSSAFRREIIDLTEDSFIHTTAHDWALMVRTVQKGSIQYIGNVLQRYRQHSNNASVIKDGNRKNKRMRFIQRQKEIICSTLKYVDSQHDRRVLDTYISFLNKRIDWIKNRKVFSIVLNYGVYKRLKYTTRNILGDIVSSVS